MDNIKHWRDVQKEDCYVFNDDVSIKLADKEIAELRAALEALQAENAKLREENEKYQKLFDEIEQHKKALKLCRKI